MDVILENPPSPPGSPCADSGAVTRALPRVLHSHSTAACVLSTTPSTPSVPNQQHHAERFQPPFVTFNASLASRRCLSTPTGDAAHIPLENMSLGTQLIFSKMRGDDPTPSFSRPSPVVLVSAPSAEDQRFVEPFPSLLLGTTLAPFARALSPHVAPASMIEGQSESASRNSCDYVADSKASDQAQHKSMPHTLSERRKPQPALCRSNQQRSLVLAPLLMFPVTDFRWTSMSSPLSTTDESVVNVASARRDCGSGRRSSTAMGGANTGDKLLGVSASFTGLSPCETGSIVPRTSPAQPRFGTRLRAFMKSSKSLERLSQRVRQAFQSGHSSALAHNPDFIDITKITDPRMRSLITAAFTLDSRSRHDESLGGGLTLTDSILRSFNVLPCRSPHERFASARARQTDSCADATSLFAWSAHEIASVLFVHHQRLFSALIPEELARFDSKISSTTPTLSACIDEFNQLCAWVAWEMAESLRFGGTRAGVKMAKLWIRVILSAGIVGDLWTVAAVATTLDNVSRTCFSHVWEGVSSKYLDALSHFVQLVSSSRNFHALRQFMSSSVRPIVPFLGPFQRDSVVLREYSILHPEAGSTEQPQTRPRYILLAEASSLLLLKLQQRIVSAPWCLTHMSTIIEGLELALSHTSDESKAKLHPEPSSCRFSMVRSPSNSPPLSRSRSPSPVPPPDTASSSDPQQPVDGGLQIAHVGAIQSSKDYRHEALPEDALLAAHLDHLIGQAWRQSKEYEADVSSFEERSLRKGRMHLHPEMVRRITEHQEAAVVHDPRNTDSDTGEHWGRLSTLKRISATRLAAPQLGTDV
jgi:hypothetical protein